MLKDNPAETFYQHIGARYVTALEFDMFDTPLIEHVYVWDDLKKISAQGAVFAPQV